MVCKRGALISRQGGEGHNDEDYYSGGSLIYNLVTIYDPAEKFRRERGNENDGGLLRHVYETEGLPRERGSITAFENQPQFTYAAANLAKAYDAAKAREVSRQFLYLRGAREFLVVFDRVEATRAEFRRHFFLHVPTQPERRGASLNWTSLPEADGDGRVLSTGRSRMFMQTLLPAAADVVIRGGPGRQAWGHPLEKTAQYNHVTEGRSKPPLCPWRIEVADLGEGARSLFLQVFEITEEAVTQPTPLHLAPPAGVDIGDLWRVRFAADGPPGGEVNGRPLTHSVEVGGQYPQPYAP